MIGGLVMRDVVTSVAEIVGAVLVSAGAFVFAPAAGLVVAGGFLLAFARGVNR